jgi:hypothetical protein
MGWSCAPFVRKGFISKQEHINRGWPAGYSVVLWYALHPWIPLYFYHVSFPREISMRSCSNGRCVRSGARIWWTPPPRCMRSEHWKESSRLYFWDCQQSLIFGVESGEAFNVLTTDLFQIQQSSHESASTLCLSEHQVKLAEQGVDQDETKDARPCDRYNLSVHYLSITVEKMWGSCRVRLVQKFQILTEKINIEVLLGRGFVRSSR